MKPKLIVMSHGLMAQETLKSAQMIVGEIDGAVAISMLEADGLEVTTDKLRVALEKIGTEDVVILVDLLGGTPSNVAVKAFFEQKNIEVVTGLNLSLVIEYAVSPLTSALEMAEYLATVGKDSIQKVERLSNDFDEEDEYEED
ncbi:PTS sugar transporter subunit IIA [Isobaculum melis]|uniref:PTS system, mannose-specific IIA component n=1 Tax=Isobaculum melis TaxID=142588 RepID=A0A1H9PNQ5_9LACT|nr:PTS sugar transporter subunit IIA [Isobaculum melis]SER49787.1 PTS system, mannose-specific IIA component [Isobaculum melis]